MAVQFTYNQEQAVKGGQSLFIDKTGAYVGRILEAKYTTSQSGALAMEFSFETDDGMKGDYLSVFYQSKDGNTIPSGVNMIQAIMGCTGVRELNRALKDGKDIAPELTNKRIGLFLQKVLYIKNNGQDGYRFQILCPFSASSRKTLAEHIENRNAERIDWLATNSHDKDERNKPASPQQAYGVQNAYYAPQSQAGAPPENNFDDDIPF